MAARNCQYENDQWDMMQKNSWLLFREAAWFSLKVAGIVGAALLVVRVVRIIWIYRHVPGVDVEDVWPPPIFGPIVDFVLPWFMFALIVSWSVYVLYALFSKKGNMTIVGAAQRLLFIIVAVISLFGLSFGVFWYYVTTRIPSKSYLEKDPQLQRLLKEDTELLMDSN